MKNVIVILIVVLVLFGAGWYFSRPSGSNDQVLSRSGLHWHSTLNINILGHAQDIPAGLGLEKLPHNPLHTHDRDNVIHMEYAGLVRNTDLQLGNFFKVWGKKFSKDCILDKCSGPEDQLRMFVNGKENSEFESYSMRDGDKLEIIFEKSVAEEVKEISVTASNFEFDPSTIRVKSGEKLKIIFKNQEGIHNLSFEELGISTKTIGAGEDLLEFMALAPGNYAFSCSVPGHAEAGMRGSLIVE